MKELSIYIHIPFCVSKCIYCNFNSFPCGKEGIEKYFEALKIAIEKQSKEYKDYTVTTIYIGGGTPSFVEREHITELVQLLREKFKIRKNIEFTIECNPESVTLEKIQTYKNLGINRFSVGLQAGSNRELKMLNRPHTVEDFLNVVKIFKDCDITNYNVDILIGLPNQTLNDMQNTLNLVLSNNPTSISAYGLIVEDGTILSKKISKGELIPLGDDESVKFYDYVVRRLKKNGYAMYEVSNFAKKGKLSKHNYRYWTDGDYIGFGLSAHSKIGDNRFCNTDDFKKYIESEHKYEDFYTLTKEDKMLERIMLTLRTKTGLNIERYNREFNIDFLKFKGKEIDILKQNKFVYIQGKYLKVTQKGFKILNGIIDILT